MEKPFLKIKNLTKIYKNNRKEVKALHDISLTIDRGEIFSLLGVNGAGKTTLSSILATLHPPTSGQVLYEEKSIYDNIVGFRKDLGFCPQEQNLDKDLTVKENLIFAGRYFLMPENEIKQRVNFLMEKFEISQYANYNINTLSGGNKQRALIARSVMHKPKIVILDEPTVGLDPDIRRKLWNHILELKKMVITIILTTHYLDEAEYLSDRVCILHKGKKLLLESVKALKAQHQQAKLEDIFLKLTHEADNG